LKVQTKNLKKKEVKNMGKSKMTTKAARRIQSSADKKGNNQNFKARAQKAASKNARSK